MQKLNNKNRILFFDIETSYNVSATWSIGRKVFIPHDMLLTPRKIMAICYMWDTDKKAKVLYWDMQQNDKELLKKFSRIYASANVVVGHNSDRFDIRRINDRLINHNLAPLAAVPSIDTLKLARKIGDFNSYKLDYLGQYLGYGAKIKTDFSWWKRIVENNDRKVLKDMGKYGCRDVELDRKIFHRLRPYSKLPVHFGVMQGKHKWTSCRECAGSHLQKRGPYVTLNGMRQRFQCMDCGTWQTGAMIG